MSTREIERSLLTFDPNCWKMILFANQPRLSRALVIRSILLMQTLQRLKLTRTER
jgi:hypothetical protein